MGTRRRPASSEVGPPDYRPVQKSVLSRDEIQWGSFSSCPGVWDYFRVYSSVTSDFSKRHLKTGEFLFVSGVGRRS